jgi:hypothetical protein
LLRSVTEVNFVTLAYHKNYDAKLQHSESALTVSDCLSQF